MPIQPLAPTRRLKARLWLSPWPGRSRHESAGGDFLGEKGAHLLRAASHIPAAGGSDRNCRSMRSSRRHQRPEVVGAAPRDQLAELCRPIAFAAEIVAPRQHAQREAMQNVFLGEADGAEHLMRDRGALGGGFAGADFGRGGFQNITARRKSRSARWRRRQNRRPRARRRSRRLAARDFAAWPGICRSAVRMRRAHWRKRR